MDAVALSRYFLDLIANWSRPAVVELGGYPLCGKTFVATTLSGLMTAETSAVIPTESFIESRSERRKSGKDGSAVLSHKMALLDEAVSEVLFGRTIELPEYSWQTGGFLPQPLIIGGSPSVLIIDGSVATEVDPSPAPALRIFFQPADVQKWVRLASLRDVEIRAWSFEDAMRENRSKMATCEQHRRTQAAILPVDVFFPDEDDWSTMSYGLDVQR